MFKSFWKNLNHSNDAAPPADFADASKWSMLNESFPIGKRLRYSPEFRERVVFQTLLLAYRVNDKYLYSRDAVRLDGDGQPTGFMLPDKKLLPLNKVESFQVLVPDTTDMEKTLDYFTRAEMGRAGQFRQGNTITLFAETAERGIPTMDTRVDRRQTLKTGPFADNPTILLTPDFDTLVLADQRRLQRVQTDLRADLYLRAEGPPFRCVLGDFSESSMRLRIRDDSPQMPLMEPEQHVVVAFGFGGSTGTYRIKGKLFRRTDDFCVIQIEQLYKDGEFESIKKMDLLEIKTGLLNQ